MICLATVVVMFASVLTQKAMVLEGWFRAPSMEI